MSFWELSLIALGLSMDAFAVAACAGLAMPKVTIKKSLIVGLYFGVFQGGMPLIGWFMATWFADKIITLDHWIAFALLSFIGGRMIMESLKKEVSEHSGGSSLNTPEPSLSPAKMIPLAVATSIDALAVGISFAFLRINIASAVSFIGVTTFALSVIGVKIGNIFGIKFKSKAEFAGGIILVLIGLKILFEHTGVI